MHMIAGAVTGIIYPRDCLPLKNISADLANISWHAALRDMQVDIVGVRRRGTVLDSNAIGAGGISISTRIFKMINIASFGSCNREHGPISKVKGM